jgi:hypothetical protein
MDFQLSDEQVLLRDTTRDLLSRSYDPETRNKVVDTELGWSREVWGQLADIGILGLGFDPDAGGQIEIMLVLIEIGRRLAPEPVVHAALAPGALIAELGTDSQRGLLDEVAAGQRLLAFAHSEPGMRPASAAVTTAAVRHGGTGPAPRAHRPDRRLRGGHPLTASRRKCPRNTACRGTFASARQKKTRQPMIRAIDRNGIGSQLGRCLAS